MKKLYLIAILLASILIAFVVAAAYFIVTIPTTGTVSHKVEITKTWLNGTDVTLIYWNVINNTVTTLPELINITNTGDQNVTLTLSTVNQVNITVSSLTWNATNPLLVGESIRVQLNLTATYSEPTFSFDTIITAIG